MNFAQHLHLKWNDHSSSIIQVFLQSLMNEQLVDVTLSCQGQFIKVHKLILSACSPYFEMLFRIHQQKDIVIIVNSMSIHHLRLLIEFIYTGEIKIMEYELQDFLQAAEQLQIKSLYDVLQKKNEHENFQNMRTATPTNSTVNENKHYGANNAGAGDASNFIQPVVNNNSFRQPFNTPNKRKAEIGTEPYNSCTVNSSINNETYISPLSHTSQVTLEAASLSTPCSNDIKKENEIDTVLNESCEQSPTEPTVFTSSEQKRTYTKKENLKIRRPPNAFMVFANQWRRKLATEHIEESNKEISVRLGFMWRNLRPEEKAEYYKESRRVDEEHKLKYPGYYYSPMEARKRKKRRNEEASIRSRSSDLESTPGKLTTPKRRAVTPKNYESSESTDDVKYDSTSEYKPEMSDVINAVIGMGVTNCIIENNNIVTKAEIEPHVQIKTEV